ncbi:MAG: kelch repeat-containing protein [Burkholderiales bacterium]
MQNRAWGRMAPLAVAILVAGGSALAAPPSAGPNVNMVSGTRFPEGDPFLTKQNEPTIAVSSRNPRHLLAASNDYRQVAALTAEGLRGGKAWTTLYKSVDGGASWRGAVLGGCPVSISQCNDPTGLTAPLKALAPDFSADPTIRPGPYGTFFYSFIAGKRDTSDNGVVAVQRFVDKNNDIQRNTDVRGTDPNGYPLLRPAEDPILPDVMWIVDKGTPGQFKDKPWVIADITGRAWNAGKTCELLAWTKNRSDVTNAAETVPAFNVYVSYANFTGQSQSEKPQALVAVSEDCGKTFGKPQKLSNSIKTNTGTSLAIDPLTGAVYVAWRTFENPAEIYVSKSTDGGKKWTNQAIKVAGFVPYDQGSTGASFRTEAFPTIAVSVKNGQSRVHVAWTQRKVAPNPLPPYACPSANAADCDARVVMSTSLDGGNTWPTAVPVDPPAADPRNPANPLGRGHQVQPALTFAAGKLLITWLDNRLDHTEGVLRCPAGNTCTSVKDLVEVREPKGNLDPACKLPAGVTAPLVPGANCYLPDVVWTSYITDGTPYLVRRHTLDVFAAMADPADVPQFASSRVSQYGFGSTVAGTLNGDGTLTPQQGTYDIRQKEVNPPNLPMFVNGTAAFIGDYIDAAGQIIVATGDPARPYKFNVGGTANDNFTTGGLAPVFHVTFTDNRDVIPPLDGNWATPTCLSASLTTNGAGQTTGSTNFSGCATPGYAGNRNQNVYSAIVSESSVAFANANSKLLSSTTPRGFVVTVQNLSDQEHTYVLSLPAQAAGVTAAFNKGSFAPGTEVRQTSQTVIVQPRSSSTRTVWATSTAAKAKVSVKVDSTDAGYSSTLVLNADPTGIFVTNGDGSSVDKADDSLGAVVLSNAALTNNALSNNALTNAVLTNNALTNAALSNVVLSNAVLSNLQVENLDPSNAALSNAALTNNVLTNAALSNVVLTNAVLSNNALSNAALSNAVLTNNALTNVALTNIDPANVALSNAVLSNNALTNVVLSNDPAANALSNAMLSNAVLSNAALSNVVLSNAALSNAALTNNALSNVALTNAPLGDANNGGDPEALRTIEPAGPELASNDFKTGELQNSNFRETSFTVRNRGNTDTTLAIKLMLRDAVCTGAPLYQCTTPAGYKLQLILRKVELTPTAIAPTGPANSTGRALRAGLAQRNAEVSNVGTLPIIDPTDPNLGKFLPDDPRAATLALAPGERAHATIRAIGIGGATPPDPAELLRWGIKAVATNANATVSPLLITTLTIPASPAFVALDPIATPFSTFGGVAPITGNAVCTDQNGTPVLNGTGAPAAALGAVGNYYVDTAAQLVYGPKTQSGWGSGTPQIFNGPSGPQAKFPCPPAAIAVGPFATNAATQVSTTSLTFTPKFWGDFYTLVNVADGANPARTDRQVVKVTVLPRPPVLTYSAAFAADLTFQQSRDLAPLVSSDSPVAITFAAGPVGICHMDPDGHTLRVDHASPANCIVTVHQDGNETYAPKTDNKTIFIDKAAQAIAFSALPVDDQLTFGNAPTTLVASTTSPTAPNSGLAVTYTSLSPTICTTGGANGATVTIVGAGLCQITANQGGDLNYRAAPQLSPSFNIKKADQNLAFGAAPAGATFGDAPVSVSATSTSPTAAPSGIAIVFSSQTPSVCTNVGATVTIVAAGTCTIAANQAGNANYNPAPQVTQSFTVNPAQAQFTVSPSYFTTLGSPTTIVGKLNRAGVPTVFPADSASVLLQGAATFGPFTAIPGGPDGTFTANAGTVPSDTYTLTFTYPGNANFLAAAPATSTLRVEGFSATAGVMATPRQNHASTLLLDGNVLVTGGLVDGAGNVTASAELYCTVASGPCTALDIGQFKPLAGMATPRWGHSATLLGDGNVLVAGGVVDTAYTPTSSTEVYCTAVAGPVCTLPAHVGTFRPASAMSTPRRGHTATLLADNRVLVTGGYVDAISPDATVTAELYCAAAGGPCGAANVFVATGSLALGRIAHTATLLGDATVLIAGGNVSGLSDATAEIYCPAVAGPVCTLPAHIGTFRPTLGAMSSARAIHTTTLLQDGRVLVAGGFGGGVSPPPTASVDVYCAVVAAGCLVTDLGKFLPAGALVTGRTGHTASVLTDGWVLAAGGVDAAPAVLGSSELYEPAINLFATGASLAGARYGHTATTLPDGRVLVIGGRNFTSVLNTAELYNGPP